MCTHHNKLLNSSTFINTVKTRFLSSSAIGTFEHSALMRIDAKAHFTILNLMLILYPLNIPD
jgi:hypothetical protein